MQKIIVTGAAGFIGSSFVRTAIQNKLHPIVLDALTYAGHMENLSELIEKKQIDFVAGNICDFQLVEKLFKEHQPAGIIHFAAESHVDNSITGPKAFIDTNVNGTFTLLEAARHYWKTLSGDKKNNFRFLHVSTDEVFGELGATGKFSETTAYSPNSPYSASKAASDHLVRAWQHTYGLPCIITNCSNNYGPRHFPEKLIPRMIQCALNNQPLPVYGKGLNIRDWIHVEDHAHGVFLAFSKGQAGDSYCFGGNSERTNIEVVTQICQILDRKAPRADGKPHAVAITHVEDRLGHDFRYAIDDAKAQKDLGFTRKYKNFEAGIEQTIDWYLENKSWVQKVMGKKKADA